MPIVCKNSIYWGMPMVCQNRYLLLPALIYPVRMRAKRFAYVGIESGIEGTKSLAAIHYP